MLQKYTLQPPAGLRAQINEHLRQNEFEAISQLIAYAELSSEQNKNIQERAQNLIKTVREARQKTTGIDSFLQTYALSTEEGIALMCIAEALLRIPDKYTIDKLIRDKLTNANWRAHASESDSFFVNITTWALILTGDILKKEEEKQNWWQPLKNLLSRTSEPFVRVAIHGAMKILSKQFVMGRTIEEAITRGKAEQDIGFRYSYDMLGEAAITSEDANRYFKSYQDAIIALGERSSKNIPVQQKSDISVKLSALYPRYEEAFAKEAVRVLSQQLLALASLAKSYDVGLTIDAEETECLNLSLDIFEQVYLEDSLANWEGLGLAVQSYHKAAFTIIDWIAALAKRGGRRIMFRLIKGAYWDSEIKKTQMNGLTEYAVFTRKAFTDVSFQACCKKLLTCTDVIHPRFATHNAYSVAMILELTAQYSDYEFQCLHGMGRELYNQIVPKEKLGIACRIYAPVGSHEDLLPYLVRRLLENGANSSFVNQVVNDHLSIDTLVEDPIYQAKQYLPLINHNIPLPWAIFLPERQNSRGIDWSNRILLAHLQSELASYAKKTWKAAPILASSSKNKKLSFKVFSPQQQNHEIGEVVYAEAGDLELALIDANKGFYLWSKKSVFERASILEKFSDLLEANHLELMALACLEAGKTFSDALAEVREAVDFCRYYAYQAKYIMGKGMDLKGYTGESNEWGLFPRGVIACISPWNFPLAIFVGQVVAALVTGNTVVAKPAEQTSLIAAFTVNLMHQAGFPESSIQLLPGLGEVIGAGLVADLRVSGVLFTGSTEVARHIQKTLVNRSGPLVPLIAETGGMNAMIVDSSALMEQVVKDVMVSAFGSAGQRCSALRVLYIQNNVYERFKSLLAGATQELIVDLPMYLSTDVGPVIDKDALSLLEKHVVAMKEKYAVIAEAKLTDGSKEGSFIAPIAFEIPNIQALEREIFGPILHVIPYEASKLDNILEDINQSGYGLTLGIQSRINETIQYIRERVHVGNIYVNRNMIGAVVGLQPFGGEGLSGTGPKAGGPLYLPRLCHERTFTVDTTAAGGNANLMSLTDV